MAQVMSQQSPQPTQRSGGDQQQTNNAHVQSGSEYLQEVLGDVLAGALSSVARERPRDPVQYVADYLYKVQEEEKQLASSRYRSDHREHDEPDLRERDEDEEYDKDSGLYEDQEAPSNQSNSTASTLELEEAAAAVAITKGHRGSKSHGRRHRSRRRTNKESRDSGFAASGPSTSSSTDGQARDRESDRRSRGRTKSWRRRTAQSEPANSVTSSTSVTYHDRDATDGEGGVKRSRSLQDTRPYQRNDPRRMLSKKVPAAALSGEEYRRKRGLSSQRLPPMKDSPVPSGTIKDHLDYSINGKPKHKQLQPMKGLDKFDWQKHLKKNRKMLKENQMNNLV